MKINDEQAEKINLVTIWVLLLFFGPLSIGYIEKDVTVNGVVSLACIILWVVYSVIIYIEYSTSITKSIINKILGGLDE